MRRAFRMSWEGNLMDTCTVDDCIKPTRSANGTLCKMHYHRWYRHGSTDTAVGTSPTPTASHGRRYKSMTWRHHPLAGKNGKVYIHRVVLYDMIGPGTHPCHWCQTPVTWAPKGTPGILIPDHINGYGDDNRPENLVPSCMSCNTTRGQQARAELLRAAGWWSSHDTIDRLTTGRRREQIITTKP